MKGKKSVGSFFVLIVILIGAYFVGGEELLNQLLYQSAEIDVVAPEFDVSNVIDEVEFGSVFDYSLVICSDNVDEYCEVSAIFDDNPGVLGEHNVTLVATDEAGNTNSILVTYSVVDTTKPVIDTSNLVHSVQLNSVDFLQPTCTDNHDIICVVVIGAIDTSVEGDFSVLLTATDESGNVETIEWNYSVIVGLDTTMYTPLGYYDGIDGLTGQDLIDALNLIITDHTEYPYTSTSTDVWDILREADEDPNNPDNIIMFYTGVSHPKDCQDTTYPPSFCEADLYGELKLTEWNREHIWSKSRGDFSDDTTTPHNDTHHLVAAERTMNSTKNNRYFEDCNDGDDTNIVDRGYGNYTCNEWEFEPRDEVKGDVARMLFYMAVRYEGDPVFDDGFDLVLANDPDEDKSLKLPIYGDIDDLLRWHIEDPVSQWEIDRNEVIYSYQGNRNPFIEHPELVELIWGSPEDYE